MIYNAFGIKIPLIAKIKILCHFGDFTSTVDKTLYHIIEHEIPQQGLSQYLRKTLVNSESVA